MTHNNKIITMKTRNQQRQRNLDIKYISQYVKDNKWKPQTKHHKPPTDTQAAHQKDTLSLSPKKIQKNPPQKDTLGESRHPAQGG